MRQGEVIGGRFAIERRVGAGGMGEVYRALDQASGEAVAVKVLHHADASSTPRFAREAEVLAELHHPGIVRYVAHGTAAGEPYLAMEWLEGEDLASRLQREGLTVDETVTLVTRVAEALAPVHARGIVHRDLKPSNLFLVEGDIARVKLLDFGITKLPKATRMTRTGVLLGTPGYMAPEQVQSQRDIDARADVFALGCVLFKCLTGTATFASDHLFALFAKILFEEAPSARSLRSEVSPALDALCARMLAKEPDERPCDGAAVAEALAALGIRAAGASGELSPGLTQKERRILSVILIGRDPLPGGAEATLDEAEAAACEALCQTAEARGGQVAFLADGSVAVAVTGAKVATDQAALAARCALGLRRHAQGWPMALATGRGERTGRMPIGDAIDRAAAMLTRHAPEAASPAPIAIDEVTAGLLDARFDVTEGEQGLLLSGERELAEGARTLLGKPTTCVGRDWELGTLEQLFTECVEDSRARAVLVTAPAGMGKSRLAYEFMRRLRQRDEGVAIWIGRGESSRTGSAFGLLGQVLRSALLIQDGEPLDARRQKFRMRVAERVTASEQRRVSEFLGEIVGTPFSDDDSVPLRAARKDAQLMGDQTLRAWVDFLDARCAAAPVLLVLEDLHWGDLPTVRFIDEALRRLKDKPWMVLALSRPEVHDLFPRLWAERNVQEIRIRELSRKASARLVRQVLGERVSAETVEGVVTRADGNAFYLEELIRATAEGTRETLPETVLAMVQSRLDALDSEARRVLRAASVFGEVFWRGAVETLLGGGPSVPSLDEHIERLERLEWISARQEARFQGERDLCFRHALVREAAYSMLTEEDRSLAHQLAGAWLERACEPAAAVIAEHFERGGDPARAASGYQRAAVQALAANDFGAVLSWTERALSLGAGGEASGELALLRAEVLNWRGELGEAWWWARRALDGLPKGSPPWYAALGEAVIGSMHRHQEGLAALADELASAWSEEKVTGPALVATARIARDLFIAGLYDRAEALHARLMAVAARFRDDPAVTGRVFSERYVREQFTGNTFGSLALVESTLQCFEQSGDLRNACHARMHVGFTLCLLGAYVEAAALLRVALADAEQMGLERIVAAARHNLGLALSGLGAFEEARSMEEQAIVAFAAQGNQQMEGGSRKYLAQILWRAGALEEAEAEARRAVELVKVTKPRLVAAHGILAGVLLTGGRSAEALAEAREAMALLASLGNISEGEALVRLAYAEALFATGDHAVACTAIAEARDRLLATAARIDDPKRRTAFLENVLENARTLELARQRLGEPTAPA